MSDLHRRLDDLRALLRRQPPPPVRAQPPRSAPIEDVLGGAEWRCAAGACWRIATPLDAAWGTGGAADDARPALRPEALLTCPHAAQPVVIAPRAALLLDIETGGFAGTPVFLVGFLRLGAQPLEIVQLLVRDYAEEPVLLAGLAELRADCDTWITFNGRSFDAPFLRDRAVLHRVELPAPRLHFDLLHAARRAWRTQVSDCRLATLERELLGRARIGDVPGRDIPDLFHHFQRTGNAAPLRPVLEHNRRDLCTAVALLARLVTPVAAAG